MLHVVDDDDQGPVRMGRGRALAAVRSAVEQTDTVAMDAVTDPDPRWQRG
jgi:hypothetical protein